MLGKIKEITEGFNYKIQPVAKMEGKGGRLGMVQMLNILGGYADMDGYKVETDKHVIYVLIDNDNLAVNHGDTSQAKMT